MKSIENKALEGICRKNLTVSFAILIMTPDDMVTKRGSQNAAPRDNILFELV